MAAIDKIYGTEAQRVILLKWVRRHRPKAAYRVWQKNYSAPGCDDEPGPIASFRYRDDAWLARKCPLRFVLERLVEQYSSHKIGRIAQARLSSLPLNGDGAL